ncbi:MAG: DUF1003 domain-containing protein [Comamonadaceae bacterium]|nr:MAG: DUF1003 domain-containing protein [Comamonadaceae bacterium]
MNALVERNIQALIERRRSERRSTGLQEKVADAITRFAGSMPFVYLHLALYGGWIVVNLGWTPFPKFDPTFVVLAMAASVEAIFISTFVMISQNRMAVLADQRADLDLQISLLSEHEITRLVMLVTDIARHLELPSAQDPSLNALAKDIAPERVLDQMQKVERKLERPDA